MGVELEPKLPGGTFLVEVFDPQCPGRGLGGILCVDAVFEGRGVDFHAADAARASRMTSERDLFSRAARASMTASSAAVRRRVTICVDSLPRLGLPRPRFFSASTS